LPTGRHRRISDFLNDSEILINPEKYFGPNCKILLNFWIYWESLTSEQRCTYYSRVNKLSTDIYNEARVLAIKTAGQSLFKQLLNTLTYLEREIVGMHEILEEGTGEVPEKGDGVSLHYNGVHVFGDKFDSSFDRNAPLNFDYLVMGLIPGFNEGVGLSKQGMKINLYIPYYLGYGPQGRMPTIPPYSDLIFELEILEVTKK
jgi:hypothetical protein